VSDLAAGGRSVRVTTPERVLFPAVGFTKGDLVRYYRAIAPALLPHLADRPTTLARFPEGVDAYGWYQTECRGPDWIRRRLVGTQRYCVIDDLASLMWAANAAAIELHPLPSRGDEVDRPTHVVLDLDPGPPAALPECCRVALALRARLAADALDAVPKVSGSLGLHVVVPVDGEATFTGTKAYARALARELAAAEPDLVVDRPSRALRQGRVFVDWSQHVPTRSLVAPYSLRASHRPVVAAPVEWDEVERAARAADAASLAFAPDTVLERVERRGDLARPLLEARQKLPRPQAI
jgi:bifunctional non-homologous end joining protein LigD